MSTPAARRRAAAALTALAVAAVTPAADAAPADGATVTPPDGAAVVTAARVLDGEGRPALVEVTAATAAEERREALEVPGSIGVAVEAPVTIASTPDPDRWRQWGNDALRIDSVPAPDTSGQLVAVLDTGILAAHEDFAPGQVRCDLGADFTGESALPRTDGCIDPHGHGTHVAGTVGAVKGNGKGVEGLAPGVQLMPVRVLNTYGGGGSFAVSDGIVWAVDHGATVINMSLAGPYSAAYDDAVRYATSRNVVVVAAAGNNRTSGNAVLWPAASPGAVSVAATDPSGGSAYYSNSSGTADIAAPGSSVYSTGRTQSEYAYMSGTSMAAPHVAAGAALRRATRPADAEADVVTALLATADDIEALGRDKATGAGFLDVHQLVTGAEYVQLVPPAAPAAPVVEAGADRVQLAWPAVAPTAAAPVSGYRVYRDGALVHTTADTSFTDTAVTTGTAYSYSVAAHGAGGESARSAAVTATPTAPAPEPAPTQPAPEPAPTQPAPEPTQPTQPEPEREQPPPAPAQPTPPIAAPPTSPAPTQPAPNQPAPPPAPAPSQPAPTQPARATVSAPGQVAKGSRAVVRGADFRPGTRVAVSETYRATTTQRVIRLVDGRRVVSTVTTTATRTAALGATAVRPDGTFRLSVLPVQTARTGMLTVMGTDRTSRAVALRTAITVGQR